MEFQYRAGDERRIRSPPPPTPSPPSVPSTSGSGSADAHGGSDGPAERVRDAALVLWKPPPLPPPDVAAADSADELRRQAEKARIRERILREEAEHWELELEVRREIREQLLRLSWPAFGRSAGGSGPPERIVSGNASLQVAAHDEVHPKANGLAASQAKRKSPDHAAASILSAATSSKKQMITMTCTVCDISTNSEKGMQDHLNGKVHKRKATALVELPKPMTEPEPETGEEVLVPSGDYTPTKLTMLTNAGAMNEVMQMDGYLLCEVCNVRTADRVTMMCHLEGSKHISKSQRYGQASSKPPDEAAKKVVKGVSVPEAPTTAVGSADPETLVLELHGVPHTVRRLKGFLLCELCNVKTPSMNGMQNHLSGKKHKNKANASSDVSANVITGGEEAPKAQPMETDTAVVAGMSVQVEVPLAMSSEAKVGDYNELQETTMASTKEYVITVDSTKTHGKKVIKASGSTAAAQDDNFCDPDSLTMEVDSLQHPLQRVDGFLVCPCCNVRTPSEIIMRSHLAGKKHRRNRTLAAGVNKDASVLAEGADEVQGNSSKFMRANVDVESATSPPVTREKNDATTAPMEVDRLAEDKPNTCIEHEEHGQITPAESKSSKSVKADEEGESVLSLTAPQVKNATAMAPMEVDGTAEVEPAIHMDPEVNGGIDEEVESAPQAENVAAMAPIEGDGPAKVQPATRIEPAEDGELTHPTDQGEHASARANGSVTQVEESMKADTAAPGKPMKIQVEGMVFTVLQQENGGLSCETCGVHGCNKDSMILHLYTRTHWDRANLPEKEKQ